MYTAKKKIFLLTLYLYEPWQHISLDIDLSVILMYAVDINIIQFKHKS